jgi:hypothetical protein
MSMSMKSVEWRELAKLLGCSIVEAHALDLWQISAGDYIKTQI